MKWIQKTFEQLSTTELYNILKERVLVFVVEQECPYPEIDDYDEKSIHLYLQNGNDIVAYCRILPKGYKYDEVSIGRVLITKHYRKKGYGHDLMNKAIEIIHQLWGETPIKLQAQSHLSNFYGQHRFQVISDEYMDDGIPHVDMIRK